MYSSCPRLLRKLQRKTNVRLKYPIRSKILSEIILHLKIGAEFLVEKFFFTGGGGGGWGGGVDEYQNKTNLKI